MEYSTLVYGIREDIAYIGSNPEMADMSNPTGAIEGSVHYIVAETPTGRRFAHNAFATTYRGQDEHAGHPLARIEALVAHLSETTPDLNMSHWDEIDPCYGSEAYISQGTENKNRIREIEDAHDNGEIPYGEAVNLILQTVAPL